MMFGFEVLVESEDHRKEVRITLINELFTRPLQLFFPLILNASYDVWNNKHINLWFLIAVQ